MAKFTLTIETDDAGELAELAAAMADLSSPYEREETPKAEPLNRPMETEPGEDKPRRTRRTKAEMEADARASSVRGAEPVPEKSTPSPSAPATSGSLQAATPPSTETVTAEMVKQQLNAAMDNNLSPAKAQEIMISQFGAGSVGKIDPARYPELLELFKSLSRS
jgi:hypothetical protein